MIYCHYHVNELSIMGIKMTEYYLWLLQVMGAANPRSVQLLRHFGNPKKVYEKAQVGDTGFLKPAEFKQLKNASLERSHEIIKWCDEKGIQIITLDDEDYPLLLQNIFNPPILLFVDGDISGISEELCITVIGTRYPSEYTTKVTETVCRELTKTGVIIISGFAVGIDKSAHTITIETGGRTIGVLACGIDIDYPRGSLAFRKKVKAKGGAAITELLPGQTTEKGYFHLRNRILSGLSQGTLIAEAGGSSGCHITANYCISQNRDLFCVPPADVFAERYSGVIRYLRDGAIPVFSFIDILQQYKTGLELKISAQYYEEYEKEKSSTEYEAGAKPRERKPIAAIIPEKPPLPDFSTLSPIQRQIAELLSKEPQTLDYLKQMSDLDMNELCDILLDMELDGIVESLPGARYGLK